MMPHFRILPLFLAAAVQVSAQPAQAPEDLAPGNLDSPSPFPAAHATPGSSPTPSTSATPADRPAARAQPVTQQEIIARLQIFLDQQGFGPGKIDGAWGEFTWKALRLYQTANGLEVYGTTAPPTELPLPLEDIQIYDYYTIAETDLKYIGEVPATPAEKAKKKSIPYDSLLEFLSERFHCDSEFIRKLNPALKLDQLKPGDTVRVPKVAPFYIENQKEENVAQNPEFLNRLLRINTRERILTLTEGDKILAAFPITPGSSTLPAPPGVWKIVGIAKMPWFRWDEAMLKQGVRSQNFHNIPPGPNNPVGVVWMGLSKSGIGIHGTNSPMTIGRSASHGCVRVANWDVVRLADMVSKGCVVKIDQPDAPLVPTPAPSATPQP